MTIAMTLLVAVVAAIEDSEVDAVVVVEAEAEATTLKPVNFIKPHNMSVKKKKSTFYTTSVNMSVKVMLVLLSFSLIDICDANPGRP